MSEQEPPELTDDIPEEEVDAEPEHAYLVDDEGEPE